MPERYSGVKMKFTIDGFSQKKAVELGLSAEDLTILRWFVDFQGSDKMIKFTLDDGVYVWVSYSYFLEDMPIIKCNRKNLSAKFQRLVDAGVLKHQTIKQGGTFSAYCFGPTYKEFISTSNERQESADRVPETRHPISNSVVPVDCKRETPLPENDRTNIHLLDNPSTKNNTSSETDKIFLDFPLQDGTKYSVTESMIAEWESVYSKVDVHQAVKEMRMWLIANPAKQKTRRGTPKFVTGWLSGENKKASAQKNTKSGGDFLC